MRALPDIEALARVPDLPGWVDTRGMLLSGRAELRQSVDALSADDGFVVILRPRALIGVVGRPAPSVIADSAATLEGDVNVLCPLAETDHVQGALPAWRRSCAILHALPGPQPWESDSDPDTTIFRAPDAPSLTHVPDALRTELTEALRGYPITRFVGGTLPPPDPAAPIRPLPMAAVLAEDRLVAFCYPVLQTETLWDVSVDTLEGYRGRGFAARAARTMTRHMRALGKAPVWGALATNTASLAVARRLGFVEAGRLGVFTCR